MSSFWGFLAENLETFYSFTGVANATPGHLIMILVGLLFIFLAIRYEFEPMLLILLASVCSSGTYLCSTGCRSVSMNKALY